MRINYIVETLMIILLFLADYIELDKRIIIDNFEVKIGQCSASMRKIFSGSFG